MKLSETIYDDAGKALGLLIWNDAERVASFTPRSDGLAVLRKLTWPCPIEARRTIKAVARGRTPENTHKGETPQ